MGNAFASGAEGPRFKSRAGPIVHSAANGSPPLRPFFERSFVARRRNDAEMGPANSLRGSALYSEYNERFDLKLNGFGVKAQNSNTKNLPFQLLKKFEVSLAYCSVVRR